MPRSMRIMVISIAVIALVTYSKVLGKSLEKLEI